MARNVNRNRNEMIKLIVIFFDFIVINILMLTFIELGGTITPKDFISSPKITFFLLNMSMAIAQFMYSTVIHLRKVKYADIYKQVLKLILINNGLFFVSMKILADSPGMFDFMGLFSATSFIVLLVVRISERSILNIYRKSGGNTVNVVFIGNDPANAMLFNSLTEDAATGYRVIGYFANGKIANVSDDFRHIGTMDDLHSMMSNSLSVSENDKKDMSRELADDTKNGCKKFQLSAVDEIFCSLSHDKSADIKAIMEFCDKNVIHFFYVPRQFGNFQLSLKPERVGEFNVYTNHKEPLANMTSYAQKRAFDIVFSGLICLLLLPFIPIIALIIKLQSPGPLFFKQQRTGINGATFNCLKFRSMHVNNDCDTKQATKNDPRKFPFGNFMRKTNIDELPQFFNVLRGDMSVVGPRPHMIKHTEQYSEIIDKYMVRHFCKPGITGYAQVTGFRGETKEVWQMEERIRRDIWYIENWSFGLDLKIIVLTIKSIIIPDKNAY